MAENIRDVLRANLTGVLPHKSEEEIDDLVQYLVDEGVMTEPDLRFMTVSVLKTNMSFVDASKLHEAWQAKFGDKSDQGLSAALVPAQAINIMPSSSASSASSSSVAAGRSCRLPAFDTLDSPYIPAGVKAAILNRKRPKARDQEDFVVRIVDHTMEAVRDLQRSDFKIIADRIVQKWPETFQDTIITDSEGKGSLAFRKQLVVRYDNIRRKDPKTLFSGPSTTDEPQAYGCINWSPPLPEGQTEASQEDIRQLLKKIHDAGQRRWDWKTIKSHLEDSFYLQRKDINVEVQIEPANNNRRSRKRKANEMLEKEPAVVVPVKIHIEKWPFLMEVKGMNCHFKKLTGVDFEGRLTSFIESDGKRLVEFLGCKSEVLSKMRRTVTRHEEAGNYNSIELTLMAVLQMLVQYFKEDINAVFIIVEETVEFDDVTEELMKSEQAHTDGAPLLVIGGKNPYDFENIFFFIDNKVLTSVTSLKEAVVLLFQSHFVFNLQYSKHVQVVLNFIQRAIANINPQQGNKCISTAIEKKATSKAVKFNNLFQKYKQDEEEEFLKENNSVSRRN